MIKKLPIGVGDYAKVINKGYAYVDKTKFIEVLESRGPNITFFRPRRFGKSLFLSTLKYYYDYKYADAFDSLFGDTHIGSNPTPLRNSYSVISFNFSGIKDLTDLDDTYNEFSETISSSIQEFLISNAIKLDKEFDYSKSPAVMIDYFLKIVPHYLKHPLYILIDEYDHFLNKLLGSKTPAFKTLVNTGGFVRNFFEKIKANADSGRLDKIFMTGVCPITLDSLTSGFNITINMTLRPPLHDLMGFTYGEARHLMDEVLSECDVDCDSLLDKMASLYNGYRFCLDAKNKLFNSDMVLYYLQAHLDYGKPPRNTFDPNILSDYSKLQSLVSIDLGDKNGANYIQIEDAKKMRVDSLISILGGEPQPVAISEVYELVKFDQNDFLSLLFYTGYLTLTHPEDSLTLPNAIIKRVFCDYFLDMSLIPSLGIDSKKNEDAMEQMSMNGKNDKFVQAISDTLAESPDRIYLHFAETSAQLIGYSIAKNYTGYETEIEKDVGYGHIDLTLLPSAIPVNYYGLIELKYIKAGALNPVKNPPDDMEKHRMDIIKERWDDAFSKLKKYSKSSKFTELQSQGRLKHWIIIFSTHRCLVNQEIDVNSDDTEMELLDFGGWWFESAPKNRKPRTPKQPSSAKQSPASKSSKNINKR
jgi:hypothetical protein